MPAKRWHTDQAEVDGIIQGFSEEGLQWIDPDGGPDDDHHPELNPDFDPGGTRRVDDKHDQEKTNRG
jgi:hypothetical protein